MYLTAPVIYASYTLQPSKSTSSCFTIPKLLIWTRGFSYPSLITKVASPSNTNNLYPNASNGIPYKPTQSSSFCLLLLAKTLSNVSLKDSPIPSSLQGINAVMFVQPSELFLSAKWRLKSIIDVMPTVSVFSSPASLT